MAKEIDFARAKLLMDFIVSAGQHGPMYQKLASEAGRELKAMIDDKDRADRVVTPPEGPANSAVERADGSIERIPPTPLDNTVAGQRSEKTGEDLNARARRMADQADLPGDKEAIDKRKALAEDTARREEEARYREQFNREPDPRRKI